MQLYVVLIVAVLLSSQGALGNEIANEIDCFSKTNITIRKNESLSNLDILIMTLPPPNYFEIKYQIPGLCIALAHALDTFESLSNYNIRLIGLLKQYDVFTDYDNLINVFQEEDFSFVGILGPDLEFDQDVIWSASANSYRTLNSISYSHQHGAQKTQIEMAFNTSFFYQTRFPLSNLNEVYIKLFQIYNWKRVAILFQLDVPFFRDTADQLYDELVEYGIKSRLETISYYTVDQDSKNAAVRLGPSGSDYRVFLLLLDSAVAARAACEFYKQGIFGDNYVVFGLPYWNFQYMTNFTDCQLENYYEVFNNGIFPAMSGVQWSELQPVDIGITTEDYLQHLEVMLVDSFPENRIVHLYDSGLASDALWVLLKAVNQALAVNGEIENVNDPRFVGNISESLKETEFVGISGTVKLKDNRRSLIESVAVYQFIDGQLKLNAKADIPLALISNDIIFPNGVPSTELDLLSINYKVADIFIIVPSTLGLVFSVFCMCTFLIFRDKPGIKLLSPRLNFVCGWGCVIVFSAILIHILYNDGRQVKLEEDSVLFQHELSWGCAFYYICFSTGFFLSLSCIVAKQYRVHKIFCGNGRKRRVPTDLELILGVFSITAVNFAVNFAASVSPEPCYEALVYISKDDKSYETIQGSVFIVCQGPNNIVILVGFAMSFAIVALGVYFSWTTRKVRVSLLNESQKVSMLVSTAIVLTLIQYLTISLFQSRTDSRSTMALFFVYTQNTILVQWIITLQVFLPGMIRLIRNPNWKPETSVIPPNIQYQSEIEKCLKDTSNIQNIEHILQLYVKTFEMWSEITHLEQKRAEMDQKALSDSMSERESVSRGTLEQHQE